MKYPHSESLKKNRDFQLLYKEGKSRANRYLVLYVKENGLEKNRLGVSVSKKVGNSIVRHRITRLIRESYRLHEEMFESGLDIVVICRVNANNASYHVIEHALLGLAKKHGIVVENEKKME